MPLTNLLIKGSCVIMQIPQHSRFRLVSCLIWCLCWPAIAVLLLVPLNLPLNLISRSDLLGHFLLFAVMAVSIIAFARTRGQIIALAVMAIAYGTALEFAQAYVPSRTFDAADAISNALGGLAGCLLALALHERLIGTATPPESRP